MPLAKTLVVKYSIKEDKNGYIKTPKSNKPGNINCLNLTFNTSMYLMIKKNIKGLNLLFY